MIVLDTNVVSELLRSRPAPEVVAWAEGLRERACITSVTLAELLEGVERLPDGHRKDRLRQSVRDAVAPFLPAGGVLPFDTAAAEEYAAVCARRRRDGRPIAVADAQIAAVCRVHGARLATRNTKDFEGVGVVLVNPWTD